MKVTITAGIAITALAAMAISGAAPDAAAQIPHPTKSDFAGIAAEHIAAGDGPPLTFYSIKADWTEPRVTPHGYHDARSQAFITVNDVEGFYGGPEDDVPEIGTRADSIGGKAAYKAFYYSGLTSCSSDAYCPPIWINESVRPGDHMAAAITISRNYQRATLKLTDTRYHKGHKPQAWTKIFREYGQFDVGEATTVGAGQADGQGSLADFGTVTFIHVTINGNVIGSYTPDYATEYNDLSGRVLATVSPLNTTGDVFTIRWVRSNG